MALATHSIIFCFLVVKQLPSGLNFMGHVSGGPIMTLKALRLILAATVATLFSPFAGVGMLQVSDYFYFI